MPEVNETQLLVTHKRGRGRPRKHFNVVNTGPVESPLVRRFSIIEIEQNDILHTTSLSLNPITTQSLKSTSKNFIIYGKTIVVYPP